MAVKYDAENAELKLIQNDESAWTLLRGGSIRSGTIEFHGKGDRRATTSQAQRFNEFLLTGCLTLADLEISDSKIHVRQAPCEDGLNLLRVDGTLQSVIVDETTSDAIDIDFSYLAIETRAPY